MAEMLVDSTKLDACLDAEADAIRAKTGDSNDIAFDFADNKGFADAIAAIPSGGGGGIAWKKVGEVPQKYGAGNIGSSNIAVCDIPDLNWNCVVFRPHNHTSLKWIWFFAGSSSSAQNGFMLEPNSVSGSQAYYIASIDRENLTITIGYTRMTGSGDGPFFKKGASGNFDVLLGNISTSVIDNIIDYTGDES